MVKRIYIVAGNYNQFLNYRNRKIKEHGLNPNPDFQPEYVYVTHESNLAGLDEIEGFYIGTYEQRTDIREIQWRISSIKSRYKTKDGFYSVKVNGYTLASNDYFAETNATTNHRDVLFSFKKPPDAMDALEFHSPQGYRQMRLGDGICDRFVVNFK